MKYSSSPSGASSLPTPALNPTPDLNKTIQELAIGIWQYIFLLFHLEELLKLYVNLFYRFCITLLFLEIFEQKKSQISELSAILDFGGYACDIISRVTQEFYP
jgi:hypothetical protein